jgi:hypothetical protein
MRFLLDIFIAFITLGFLEALIKPVAKSFVQRRILRYAPSVLAQLDQQMPLLLQAHTGKQLEQIVRTKLESLTGEAWSPPEIEAIFNLYDPRITADRLKAQ